jgi:hypothetical protein
MCPPANANEGPLSRACRFLPFDPPKDSKNFLSHVELNKPTGNAGECRARSCSLVRFSPNMKAASKFKHFANMKIGVLDIPAGCGRHTPETRGHIDFWVGVEFDPEACVTHVFDTFDELEELMDSA